MSAARAHADESASRHGVLDNRGVPNSADDQQPEGYIEPSTAWCVEYADPREPGEGSHQVGAFTTKGEAQKLLDRLEAEGDFPPLRINLVPVHVRVQDWEWDR